jgi:hypothetical protein
MTDANKDVAECRFAPYASQSVDALNDKKVRHFPTPSPATVVLAINLHGAEKLRQASRSQQGIDRDVSIGEDAPSRGAGVGCAQDQLNFLVRTRAIEID